MKIFKPGISVYILWSKIMLALSLDIVDSLFWNLLDVGNESKLRLLEPYSYHFRCIFIFFPGYFDTSEIKMDCAQSMCILCCILSSFLERVLLNQ